MPDIWGVCSFAHNIAINQNLPDINDNLDWLPVNDEVEDNFIVNGDLTMVSLLD